MRVLYYFALSFLVYCQEVRSFTLQDLLKQYRDQQKLVKQPPTTPPPKPQSNLISTSIIPGSTTSSVNETVSWTQSPFNTSSASLSSSSFRTGVTGTATISQTNTSLIAATNATQHLPNATALNITQTTSRVENGNTEQAESGECNMNRTIGAFCNKYNAFDALLGEDPKVCTVYHSLFCKDILKKLDSCEPGQWCIGGNYSLNELWQTDYVFNETVTDLLCDVKVGVCLEYVANGFANCDSYDNLMTYQLSTELLCSLRNYDVSEECTRNALMMLYLTESDLSKQKEIEDEVEEELDNTCETSDANMAGQFQCLKQACPESAMKIFYRFRPWQWFIFNLEYWTNKCSFRGICNLTNSQSTTSEAPEGSESSPVQNSTTTLKKMATGKAQPTEGTILKDNINQDMIENDRAVYIQNLEIIMGGTVSGVIVALGIVIFIFLYVRRLRTRTRPLDREGYTKLINEE